MSKKRQTRKEKLSAQSRRSNLPTPPSHSSSPTISFEELSTITKSSKSSTPTRTNDSRELIQSSVVISDLRRSIISSLVLLCLTFVLSIALHNSRVIALLNLP